jgi:predicted small secreted protein
VKQAIALSEECRLREHLNALPVFSQVYLDLIERIGAVHMRKIATVILLSVSLLSAACNTVKGVGEDIESVGEAGDKAI